MYDVIIIGAGPGGIFSAYELMQKNKDLKIAVFDAGHSLEKRHCPIDGDKVKNCIKCKTCAIMNGFGGAGAFSDGKYNITLLLIQITMLLIVFQKFDLAGLGFLKACGIAILFPAHLLD